MLKIPHTPECERVAQRLIWYREPKEALEFPYIFMAHVMTYGTLEDVLVIQKALGKEAFKEALDHMPPGIMDVRSWNYWNIVMGRYPVPPIPERKFH